MPKNDNAPLDYELENAVIDETLSQSTSTNSSKEHIIQGTSSEYPEAQWTFVRGKDPSINWTIRGTYEQVKSIKAQILADMDQEVLEADPIMAVTQSIPTGLPIPTSVQGAFCSTCGSPMAFKTGQKNGKTWKGYFCSVNADGNCKPKWVK